MTNSGFPPSGLLVG